MLIILGIRYYCVVRMFSKEELRQISHQKLLVSKTLVNSCLFAFFVVHTINGFGYHVLHIYITHMSINEAG